MSLDSSTTLRKNRVYAPLIIALAIILLVFVTRPLYSDYSTAWTTLATLTDNAKTKQSEYDALLAIEKSVQDSSSSDSARIAKISKNFNDSDILEAVLINDYTKSTAFSAARISVKDVNIDAGAKLPSGIALGRVNISITAASVDDIVMYLTYLTDSAPMAFVLDSINLPLDAPTTAPTVTASTNTVSLSLTLGVYYYP